MAIFASYCQVHISLSQFREEFLMVKLSPNQAQKWGSKMQMVRCTMFQRAASLRIVVWQINGNEALAGWPLQIFWINLASLEVYAQLRQ